jgi:hypothetical protein
MIEGTFSPGVGSEKQNQVVTPQSCHPWHRPLLSWGWTQVLWGSAAWQSLVRDEMRRTMSPQCEEHALHDDIKIG